MKRRNPVYIHTKTYRLVEIFEMKLLMGPEKVVYLGEDVCTHRAAEITSPVFHKWFRRIDSPAVTRFTRATAVDAMKWACAGAQAGRSYWEMSAWTAADVLKEPTLEGLLGKHWVWKGPKVTTMLGFTAARLDHLPRGLLFLRCRIPRDPTRRVVLRVVPR